MNPQDVILIFDIGKTTKKALVFDHEFHVLEEKTETFKEIPDDDGFLSDDLALVSIWVIDLLNHYTNHPRYNITHCNFSAYGASLVHLDNTGQLATPFYNYLKPFPPEVKASLFEQYNADKNLEAVTASPFLGLLNSGLQLYWLKKTKREFFARIKQSLHLPQYFAYLVCRAGYTDTTSVGCHTMLWDFNKKGYHDWVVKEDLEKYFAPPLRPDFSFDVVFNQKKFRMGIGVHDSSAALMPYLATQEENFLLLSTGTWNICFNPFNNAPLTQPELALDCLSYLTFEGKPVKASRIFLGREHEMQVDIMNHFFGVSHDAFNAIEFQEDIFKKLSAEDDREKAFFPVAMEGTGPLPQRQSSKTNFTAFADYDEAYHQMIRYLVRWQIISIDLLDPGKRIRNIIVVGGFTRNKLFLEILSRECLNRQILISDHPRASALGAAWLTAGKKIYGGKGGLLEVTLY